MIRQRAAKVELARKHSRAPAGIDEELCRDGMPASGGFQVESLKFFSQLYVLHPRGAKEFRACGDRLR